MPIFRLPPFTVQNVVKTLSETIDWGLSSNNIPEHWKQSKGKGIRVAVLDTGCDLQHGDLKPGVVAAKDFTGSPFGAMDRNGHGTHTAGTIGARANGTGVVGVAPECELLIGKVLGDDGSGRGEWVAAGIEWSVANGADIISMSLGSPQDDPRIHAAVDRAIAKGKIFICAAGNDGFDDSVNFPGRYTIAIAAYDKQFRLAEFSSRGPEVTTAAPGVDIVSTYPQFMGSFAKLSGTSMATPFVAGLMALALSIHRSTNNATPINNQAEAKEHLQKTAKDAGAPGFDTGFGWGLINADTLLEPAKPKEPVVEPFKIVIPIPVLGVQIVGSIEPLPGA